MSRPKVLIFDIETAPLLGYVWGLWENNVALNQIYKDWHILSWAAKWLDSPPNEVMYDDQRNEKNIEDDSRILHSIWKLLDKADVVITQNGVSFDAKKLNARFILNGFKPPSPYKHIDTKILAGKYFAFTSNKLEYMTDKLCTKYKKLKHEKFGGFELWSECLKGNLKAWKHMEKYNKYDVLSLEELYKKLAPWDRAAPNFNLHSNDNNIICNCGSKDFTLEGHAYTASGKFQRYVCKKCGTWTRSKINTLTKEKIKSLRTKV